ncbi:MAG: bifunctional phosphopantothenoylcysteine decarboxylase/phosphopantothenate--cysteine ligase CoaBC [Bacteroidetes bacterium]|nr:bifunctional phosphopantothenoylcysteine decarboxylase/phosphopantothenate--cysteine ligase CoaBC [Bacteroidota bacterium]
MSTLREKHVLVGVTGGIAAYKIAYLVRQLIKEGAQVRVMMTEAATHFVTPLTFAALSKHPVYTDLWNIETSEERDITIRHVKLAHWADIVVIAPASANTIAKLTHGIADNILTVVTLATPRPVLLAPAMDVDMYINEATQQNLSRLKERGFYIFDPPAGELASGLHGKGRLPEVEALVEKIHDILERTPLDFIKKNIVITAGPTYEPIDPVRFIGNRSSGKMGYALATAASHRGARVTLVSGPTQLQTPRGVNRINVETAQEMLNTVLKHLRTANVLIMAAAVADFTPSTVAKEKIKKTALTQSLQLTLVPTPDILTEVAKKKKKVITVGFALETTNELTHAREKLQKKNLDMIVLNSYNDSNPVFGSDINTVTIINRWGEIEELPTLPKIEVAHKILDKVKSFMENR